MFRKENIVQIDNKHYRHRPKFMMLTLITNDKKSYQNSTKNSTTLQIASFSRFAKFGKSYKINTIVHYHNDLFHNFFVQKDHKSTKLRSQANFCNKVNFSSAFNPLQSLSANK